MPPRPSHHANDSGTSFRNPWPSAGTPTWSELASSSFPVAWAHKHLHSHPKSQPIKLVTPTWGASLPSSSSEERVLATWLGHASAFAELPLGKGRTVKLLFDPMFSSRAGPTQYTGPARMIEAPCGVDELPGVDCVFISHNHYDHLDTATIQAVWKRCPTARYFVPLGNKSWFLATGIPEELVMELDWWEDCELCPEDLGFAKDECEPDGSKTLLRFTCVPAQHNSGRGAADQASSLWCGWVIERMLSQEGDGISRKTRKGSIYFAGDTGYRRHASSDEVCPVFEELGKKFGPFDLSFVPIWRGGTLGFVSWVGLRLSHQSLPSASHGSPADGVSIHQAVQSRNTIAIHFGTFVGSEAESLEAVIELKEACEDAGVLDLDDSREQDAGRMGVIDIGETLGVKIADLII